MRMRLKRLGFWLLLIFPGMVLSNMANEKEEKVTSFALIADQYEQAYFKQFPEAGMFWGKTDVDHDRFADHSYAGVMQWQKQEDLYLQRLQRINPEDLRQTPLYTTYYLLKETLENAVASRVCNEPLWQVNPLSGWHTMSTHVAETQPVGTPLSREQALTRWRTFNRVVEDEIQLLKKGIKTGYTAPKPAVEVVLKQIKLLLASPVEESPYFDMANRDNDPAFKESIRQLIVTVINPALTHYAAYLEQNYLPKAREAVGVSALPHGRACYQAKVKQETTLRIAPEAIHQFGLSHMEKLKQEVARIGQAEFGLQSMPQVFARAKAITQGEFATEQAMLDYNYAALQKAKEAMPKWFGMLPKAPAVLKPYPLFRAKTGAAGEYSPPSDDGKTPGIYYINTYEPQLRSRVDQEAVLFHELIPGHHLQIAISYEITGHHSLDKYLWNAGYGEGWALYAERVADEMGLYKDNISRLGMLSNESLRTARLVVDPGLHVLGWTRADAITYLKQHTALDDRLIEGEVDRYIMLPGQATSYMLGKRTIDDLRAMVQVRQGDSFSIRAFHDQVLKHGAITLSMLQESIQQWLDKGS